MLLPRASNKLTSDRAFPQQSANASVLEQAEAHALLYTGALANLMHELNAVPLHHLQDLLQVVRLLLCQSTFVRVFLTLESQLLLQEIERVRLRLLLVLQVPHEGLVCF